MQIFVLYYIYIYTGSILMVWSMLTASTDLVGQSTMYVLNMYITCLLESLWIYYHCSALLLMWSLHTIYCLLSVWVFECLTSACMNNIYKLSGILIIFTMALHINNDYIRYCHIDITLSVSLAWSYFSNPEYLVIQSWVHTTSLFPDSITQTEACVHHFVRFFPWEWATHMRVLSIVAS